MKTFLRRALITSIVMLLFAGFIWAAAFSIVTIPAAADAKAQRALVLSWFRKGSLEPGKLVLAELDTDIGKTRAVRRIQQVHAPDPSERMRATRRLGQALLDMDYKPKYSVTVPHGPETNFVEKVTQRRIKGVVIHVFGL